MSEIINKREELKSRVSNIIDVCEGAMQGCVTADDFYAEVVDTLGLEHALSKLALVLLGESWGEFTEEDRTAYPEQSVSDWLSEQRYAGGEPL